MIIRLLPTPSQPTIVFKLKFEDLPHNLQLPSAWSSQLTALAIDDIEVPKLLHAFDKSVGLQCILEEVRFDLVKRTVTCSFVDGESEEWPMGEELSCACPSQEYTGTLGCGFCRRSPTVMERLESVLDDVNESAKEAERERQEEEEKTRLELDSEEVMVVKEDELISVSSPSLSLNSPSGTMKGAAKKQRSMLMNLVVSLLPTSGPEAARRSRSSKRSHSLPTSRVPSPSERIAPSDASSSDSIPSSSGWTSWTSLSRSVSNPISRKTSWGRRNKHSRKYQSKSISEPFNPDSSTSFEDSGNRSSEGLASSSMCHSMPSSPTSTAPPSPALRPTKAGKHMSTSSLPTFPLAPSKSVESASTPIIIAPPPPPKLNAKALRRRARSTLVDTFRACVLPELGKRVRGQPAAKSFVWERAVTAATTYYNWSMNGMIRRVENSLVAVVDEATEYLMNAGVEFGGSNISHAPLDGDVPQPSEYSGSLFMTATESSTIATSTEATVYESAEDGVCDSDSTADLDQSALEVSRPSSPILGSLSDLRSRSDESVSMGNSSGLLRRSGTSLPSFPSVDSSTLSLTLKHVIAHLDTTYTALIALHAHLSEVLASAKRRERGVIRDAQARDDLLEVRCRRKAWLGKGWGLARSKGELVKAAQDSTSSSWRVTFRGAYQLTQPFHPSGLGQHNWTSEQWEYEPWYCFPGYCSDPEGHSHQNLCSVLRGGDDYSSCYEEEEEEEEEEDNFSLSSSSSSLQGSYQYQPSGVAYEDPEVQNRTPTEYSTRAHIRRSLDLGTPIICDETFPEMLPTSLPTPAVSDDGYPIDLRTRDIAGGLESSMELETEDEMVNSRSPDAMENPTLFAECFTNPFEDEDRDYARRRHGEGDTSIRRWYHSGDSLLDDADGHDLGDGYIVDQARSAMSPNTPPRKKSFRSSSMNEGKVFFPVSEEEFDEENEPMAGVEFTVSVDIRDNPVFSAPTTPRTRKQSMQLQTPSDFGLDIVPRKSATAPCSPTSPTSPRSPSSPTSSTFPGSPTSPTSSSRLPQAEAGSMPIPVSLLPVSSNSSNFDFEFMVSQSYRPRPRSLSQGWLSLTDDGEGTPPPPGLVGIAVSV